MCEHPMLGKGKQGVQILLGIQISVRVPALILNTARLFPD